MYKHGGDIYNHVNCIDFSANINLLGMPVEVKEAIQRSISSCEHYPDVEMRRLKQSLANRENVGISNIICGNGAAELIFSVVMAIKPKKALIMAPGFYEYEQALKFAECELVVYNLQESDDFVLKEKNQNEILHMIDESFDIVFICNPNNPTGVLTKKIFLEKLALKCQDCNTVLVVDECFLDFVDEKQSYSVSNLIERYNNLFVLKAFTKIFAIPGIRLGYALCSNKELLLKMKSGLQPWNVSVPAQEAGIAACSLSEFEKQTRLVVNEERKFLVNVLNKAGFKIYGSSANFIFFKANKDFEEKMLRNNILVRNCDNYRGLYEGFYRIAVRTHAENIQFQDALFDKQTY